MSGGVSYSKGKTDYLLRGTVGIYTRCINVELAVFDENVHPFLDICNVGKSGRTAWKANLPGSLDSVSCESYQT